MTKKSCLETFEGCPRSLHFTLLKTIISEAFILKVLFQNVDVFLSMEI